ncbi:MULTISPECIES: betaine/proline/choline family ABC transporter ATP-binding protein [Streptomyces]|uniref:ABC-type quaternary amine transporter n=3 Tax=Streptomyces TaxID=1883 RepID=A0A1E7LID8_9ACTN|nr:MULTISPECIES: betaine/proline/choline family ABC transporter ATP-binding protein [Streptomyces]ARI53838.1 ABC transporter ATP-binding protein [Streptomyces sp. S8]MYT38930.1 betaine/proline/choline family ABC transporter ATP-binding protein [Streptomyces sp. SID8356]MYT99260.1 betaine/proline/choline family ABC transporter ATP-binding protein [Streptomyces sp. SID8350]NGO82284.1 betaine/proline/choline family ABC transporter ATP-binding protein [Streptomyces sp. 196(2019)]OEV15938.1 ABC tra
MIRFEHVTKRYADGTTAVDDLSFEVAEGELVTLVGPSGCGKTTTMKMVNRLIEPTEGTIFLDGDDISAIDPVELRRRIGYVIQQVGLFPHKTVLENTATVPHLLGWKRGKGRARAAELLDLVGLDPSVYGDRYPEQLSGGQRQRVGVARALAADPPVLLMDEPFGAVDPVVRERLQNEFLKLQAQVRKTVLFVTHDIEEAVRLGDRIAVYGHGRIEQFDSPATVLGAPATPYVADFVGADRGLKRLSVTPIEESDLDRPPVVHLDDTLAEATARLRSEGARWAVVLDGRENLHGWIPADTPADGTASVREHARRMEAWLPLGAPLKQAFATMLQHDAGWIAVIDEGGEGRFLGVLTPARLHEALRRSIDADAQALPRAEVAVETVATA